MKFKIDIKKIDIGLFISVLILFSIGMLSLYSSTYSEESLRCSSFFFRQIMWFIAGFAGIVLILKIGSEKIIEWGYIIYILCLLLLFCVFLFGISRGGGNRWLKAGPFSFQPSEFVKLGIIIMTVRYLSSYKKHNFGLFKSLLLVVLLFVPVFLIAFQPDLGTALILIPVAFAIWFIASIGLKYLFYFCLTGIFSAPLMWFFLRDYQKQRLLVFVKPDLDPLGAGYTVIQSKIAIGSGKIAGKGFLSGTQNILNFLPERHTDFIFSVIGEEWGFTGCVIVLGLYIYLISRAINIGLNANKRYDKMLCSGITVLLSLHVVINIGMTMGIMPAVGLPLPFMSYGGSNLVMSMLSIGFLQDIYSRHMSYK